MPKIYGAGASPFVRKVRAVLAEKNVAYDLDPVVPVNVSAEFKKKSPLGKIPVLEDEGLILPDSSAICAYLERLHPAPALYPSEAAAYGRALWLEEYADTALATAFGPKIFFAVVIGPRLFNQPTDEAAVRKAVGEDLPPLFDYLESQVPREGWILGSYSIADIAVTSQFVNLRHAGHGADAGRWPGLSRYLERAFARPSFKTLIEEDEALFGLRAA